MAPFSLGSTCTLAQVDELHAALCEHVAAHSAEGLVIDATGVEEADVSLAQLLVAARHTAGARNLSMTLMPSQAVSGLLARTGLTGWAETVRA